MMEINTDWLVCPITKTTLTEIEGGLKSSSSEFRYNSEKQFWDFIPTNSKELDKKEWNTWNELQKNGVTSYESSPENNLGVGYRKDFIQFANFCDFDGLILDVGVGPQQIPTHIEFNTKENATFVGIDPLEGIQPKKFPFIKALGEYLPFKDNLFDQVLFVTTLDHFIDPRKALIEAKRVVKENGSILIWLGEKDKNAPKPKVSPEWYQSLNVPEGAEDPFHFKRFSISEFKGYLQEVELKIVDEKFIEVDQWRTNCFYRVSKKQ